MFRKAGDPILSSSIFVVGHPGASAAAVPDKLLKDSTSISIAFEPVSKSSSYQSKPIHLNMTEPTPVLTDTPHSRPFPSVPPIISSDNSSPQLTTHGPTTTTRTTSRSTSIAASPYNGLSNSTLTAIIVVPIVLLAIISPILIVWFLSWRWRRRRQPYNRRSIPKDVKLEKEKEKEEMEMEKNVAGSPPQAPQSRSSPPKKSTASLPPPPRKPFTTTPDERGRTRQPRTSRIPNNSLSGFNFDFSRRATMFSARNTQPTMRDPSLRPSSNYTWILPSPSPSRPMTPHRPYIPPRLETPKLPELPLAPAHPDHTSNINREISNQSTNEALPHPDSYGKLHTRASSNYSLSAENLSVHNGSNLQAPFSQPHPDAISDVSGLSSDHSLSVATQQPQHDPDAMSDVSALGSEPNSNMNPHQIVGTK